MQNTAIELISVVDDGGAFRETTGNLQKSNKFELESLLELKRYPVREKRSIPIIFSKDTLL
jgi:hypothetical protein